MQTDDRLEALARRVKAGEELTWRDVHAAFPEIDYSERQCRELLRHIRWLASQ